MIKALLLPDARSSCKENNYSALSLSAKPTPLLHFFPRNFSPLSTPYLGKSEHACASVRPSRRTHAPIVEAPGRPPWLGCPVLVAPTSASPLDAPSSLLRGPSHTEAPCRCVYTPPLPSFRKHKRAQVGQGSRVTSTPPPPPFCSPPPSPACRSPR